MADNKTARRRATLGHNRNRLEIGQLEELLNTWEQLHDDLDRVIKRAIRRGKLADAEHYQQQQVALAWARKQALELFNRRLKNGETLILEGLGEAYAAGWEKAIGPVKTAWEEVLAEAKNHLPQTTTETSFLDSGAELPPGTPKFLEPAVKPVPPEPWEAGFTPATPGEIVDQAARAKAMQTLVDWPPPKTPSNAMQNIVRDVLKAHTDVKVAVLRQVEDDLRTVMRRVSQLQLASGMPITEAVAEAIKRWKPGAEPWWIVNTGRRNWRADSYMRMALRSAVFRAQNQAVWDRAEAMGTDLVVVSSHPDSAEVCRPYQKKILALSGSAGPRRVEDWVSGKAVEVQVFSTMEDAVKNGYHHPNCRHTDVVFSPGVVADGAPTLQELAQLRQG